jgi:dihydrodipicolinate synthase/N-acetylneuraminate lyase
MMELPLKGIIPPLITPLINDNALDVAGLENLLEHLLKGGVHGLFILGTTGEATSLSYQIRKDLIKLTSEIVRRRVPIVAGITDTSISGSLEIAEYSAKMGLDGVVIAPPYYIPISQEEMREYLKNLAPRLPLPFLMYNMPSCTKIHLSVETVRMAKELGAIGIKDSSGDMSYMYSLIEEFKDSPDFSVITGTELFIPDTILYGGHGAVPGGANIFPSLFVDLYNASLQRDLAKIAILREKVIIIENTIYNVGRHKSRIIKGIKCALSVMDICNDYVAQPLTKFAEVDRMKIKKYIDELSPVMV